MQLVKLGVRWNVGNSEKIHVLTDRWIPGVSPETLRPLTLIPIGATVDILLNEDRSAWDVDVVRTIF
jgi:hypothetical protein